MANYLVTGGAGFIGSHVVERLASLGNDVTVFDNLSTGKAENLSEFGSFVVGDIRKLDFLQRFMVSVDYVIHLAALGSVPRSVADPMETHENNVTGTLNVLRAAVRSRTKRVIFASSSSVYGDPEKLPNVETQKRNPLSPYAASKSAGEDYCQAFANSYGIPVTCLRFFNVFGPRQDPDSQYASVIPKFIKACLTGDTITINGDGSQTRDFTYVDNVVDLILLACEKEEPRFLTCNIASGRQGLSVLELYDEISKRAGYTKIQFSPKRVGDVLHSYGSMTKMMVAFKYKEHKVPCIEGLDITIDWFKKQLI